MKCPNKIKKGSNRCGKHQKKTTTKVVVKKKMESNPKSAQVVKKQKVSTTE